VVILGAFMSNLRGTMTTENPLTGVSVTALSVARVRAAESRRPDALFHDPYAVAFVRAAPGRTGPARANPHRDALIRQITLRTRWYDDHLRDACAAGCRQVVLLAAGLDARAYRLPWPPGVHQNELDLPPVLDVKQRVLDDLGAHPRCTRTTVPTDLTADWSTPLTAAGLDPTRPAAWLVEGFLVYLTAAQAAHVLTTVTTLSAPGSQLACERGDTTGITATADPTSAVALWQGGLGPHTASWLTDHGWQVTSHPLADVAAGYGRPAPPTSSAFLAARRTSP
jgi:methyltransferase (TIGR00027 family)